MISGEKQPDVDTAFLLEMARWWDLRGLHSKEDIEFYSAASNAARCRAIADRLLPARETDDTDAIEAALKVLRDAGIDVASPLDGDLDDLEKERFNTFSEACRAYANCCGDPLASEIKIA